MRPVQTYFKRTPRKRKEPEIAGAEMPLKQIDDKMQRSAEQQVFSDPVPDIDWKKFRGQQAKDSNENRCVNRHRIRIQCRNENIKCPGNEIG